MPYINYHYICYIKQQLILNIMQKFTLIQAIIEISKRFGVNSGEITHCQFEDGSGFKFVYEINNNGKSFIDLKNN